jgi:phage host-nuclease inhibitor protein Gam
MLGRRALLVEQLELYYRSHRGELEKGKKSIELQFGTAGIKLSAPSFRPLKGWNWDKILTAIRGVEAYKKFIRSKETVDKAALKGAKLADEKLAAIGVKVDQKETFWFETKPVALRREDAA